MDDARKRRPLFDTCIPHSVIASPKIGHGLTRRGSSLNKPRQDADGGKHRDADHGDEEFGDGVSPCHWPWMAEGCGGELTSRRDDLVAKVMPNGGGVVLVHIDPQLDKARWIPGGLCGIARDYFAFLRISSTRKLPTAILRELYRWRLSRKWR